MKAFLFLALTMFAAVACVDQPEDISTDDSAEAPRIALNGLTPDELASVAVNPAKLGGSALNTMAATSQGKKALTYLVHCALPAGQSVTATVNGNSYVYSGGLGLAPGWPTGALSDADQKIVSACVISRANVFGVNVNISLRGNATLAPTTQESTDYQIQEGAFWGNIFTMSNPKVIFSCNGIQQAANDTYGDLPLRECAEAPDTSTCTGFSYAGLCSDVCSTTGSDYSSCTAPGSVEYTNVITTYLYGLPQ